VADVRASLLLPVSMLMSEDFPTFERPMKANSGSFRPGFPEIRVELPANVADDIFISLPYSWQIAMQI
jgi:hypothetical protein